MNLVYSDKDQQKHDKMKEYYHALISKKTRKKLGKSFLFNLARCFIIAKEKTFYPELKRKSYLARLLDNFIWCFKYGRANTFYNRFGLDVEKFRKMNDFLDSESMKKEKNKSHHKDHPLVEVRDENINIRYSVIADDKSVFYSYVGKIFPNNVPKCFFTFSGNKIIIPFGEYKNTEIAFDELPDGKYICKPTVGLQGDMIVAITKKNRKIQLSDDNITFGDLISNSVRQPFILQEFLKQHEELNKINAETVNTLRIISTRWNEETNILAAMIRIGVNKGQIVDNAHAGGTFVAINISDGRLDKYGYFYNKPRTISHPVSGVVYDGYQIPYWQETIELIKNLHPIIFGFATIGWDIAITEEGPVIVEINRSYSLKGIQVCNGGLKSRWEELKLK